MKKQKQNQRVHNLLMNSRIEKGLYTYGSEGICINFGPLKGLNLTKSYMENPEEVLEYLEKIIENDDISYVMWFDTLSVMDDLKLNKF